MRERFPAPLNHAINRTGPLVGKHREAFNPFYAVLVVVGVAFAVTACAYGVMTFVSLRAAEAGQNPAALPSSLAKFMNDYGERLLGGELLLLAVATVGAISTDRYWQRRAAERQQDQTT